MKIYVLDKILEYENNKKIINHMLENLDKIISKSNYVLSHLEIDGYEVYEDYYDYFVDNIKSIKEVKVIVKTFKELSQEILITTAEYLERSIPELEKLSNKFYKTPAKETWDQLADLFDGINWIMNTFTIIDTNKEINNIVESYETWNLYAKDICFLKEFMVEFEEILQNRDFVSIADILMYEIIPQFNKMLDKLNVLVNKGVNFNALN